MLTLLEEINFWTFDDNIKIKDDDFGAFRYHDKRIDGLWEEAKKSYSQQRGMIYVPTHKKGLKLKDCIKYLEEQLKDRTIVYHQWYNHCTILTMLNNGLLIQIQVHVPTGDVQKIAFDKYLLGKVTDNISDVAITKSHLVCVYNDNQITLVYFTKLRKHPFDRIHKLEPKLLNIDLFGSNGRRMDKKIQINKSGDLMLIWWKSTMNEVYPWSPIVKEHDRANIHLYRLIGTKVELVCYVRTEFDPLCVMFDVCHDSIIHLIQQKVSRKGEVTIEWRTYEVSQLDKLQRITVISVPLPTHTSCIKFSPNQELLLLCCIDGLIILYDQIKGSKSSTKAAFIPTLASWHHDGIIFSVGNDKGQFQHFDLALSCIKGQTLNEETTPANILDLSSYFRNPSALLIMEWNKKYELDSCMDFYNNSDSLFLLLFERGPMGVVRVIEGNDCSGDTLVRRYLALLQIEQATSLLISMNWDSSPHECMHSLNQILNYLFKLPLTPERENLIQNALGSFHVPIKPISPAIEDEYGEEIRDLTRRFFHHLLRYKMFDKAFRLAIDLNDHDLFMDIHHYALTVNDDLMAIAAQEKAEQILSRSNSCKSSHSSCSRESCSICSDSSSENPQNSYSDLSESSSKEREYSNPRRKYSKTLRPRYNAHSLKKIDHNMMSTSFNSSIVTLATDDSKPSLIDPNPDPFVASTAFRNSSRIPSINSQVRKISIENPIDGSIVVEETPICISNSEDDDFMSTPFKNPVQELDTIDNVDETIDVEKCEKSISTSHYLKNSYGLPPHSTDNTIMSTRFNKTEHDKQSTNINPSSLEIPPPPSITHSITGYWQNSHKKNNQLPKSTPGLLDAHNVLPMLHRPNSVSNIFTGSQKDQNCLPSRTYRFSYDLDYIPIYGSCDTLNNQSLTKINSNTQEDKCLRNSTNLIKKENQHSSSCSVQTDTSIVVNEKPKVKFSDTVTHILVPGKGQSHKQKRTTSSPLHVTDPKRELAESLPLCLGNEDYLKDFQPLSKDKEKQKNKESMKLEESTRIKVVHFGLL